MDRIKDLHAIKTSSAGGKKGNIIKSSIPPRRFGRVRSPWDATLKVKEVQWTR